MKPFFSYYGSKYRAVKLYQEPKHNILIEPFAGSACYSLRNYNKQVILYDINPIIYGVWDYLIKATPEEIMKLPLVIDDLENADLPQEVKWLIGFWYVRGSTEPRKQPTGWMKQEGLQERYPSSFWGPRIQQRIANQVDNIKHWKIYNESYFTIPNQEATWFIDPPYSTPAGRAYPHNLTQDDYTTLGYWCNGRKGQKIVCEQEGANWLPFQHLATFHSTAGKGVKKQNTEVVYYHEC